MDASDQGKVAAILDMEGLDTCQISDILALLLVFSDHIQYIATFLKAANVKVINLVCGLLSQIYTLLTHSDRNI